MVVTSAMAGTLVSRWVPEATKQAAICLSTAFLAPSAVTAPDRGPAGVNTTEVTLPVCPSQCPSWPRWSGSLRFYASPK